MKCLKSCSLFFRGKISGIFLGTIFLFSGLAKAVNPYGFSVKVGEYITALNLDFLEPAISFFSISLIAFELVLSFFLFLRIYPKITSWAVLVLSFIFTILTLWNLSFDSVGDCGCFGDVIKLSPLVSFLKNILILFVAIVYHIRFCNIPSSGRYSVIIALSIIILSFIIPVYVYRHLPLYDVSGYSVGSTLAYSDNSSIKLLYKNKISGEIKSFLLEDTQWRDSVTWEFVGTEKQKRDGLDFPMLREDFLDVSSDVLSSSDSMLVVIIQDPKIIPPVTDIKIRTIVLSAYDLTQLETEHYSSDFSLLKQILPNSKGGAMLIHQGQILGKWAMIDCPYFNVVY